MSGVEYTFAASLPRPPCAVCEKPADQHGSYPTCATHPYTGTDQCGHVLGAKCAGSECVNGCVRVRREPAKHDYPACALFRGGKCTCDEVDKLCPRCGSEEWDRITDHNSPGATFNRCNRCDNEWPAAVDLLPDGLRAARDGLMSLGFSALAS